MVVNKRGIYPSKPLCYGCAKPINKKDNKVVVILITYKKKNEKRKYTEYESKTLRQYHKTCWTKGY